MIDSDDTTLIVRSQGGDKRAFGCLVEKYMKQAYFTALGLVASHEAAMDLSQEAFIRAYIAIQRFDVSRSFFSWYYRILKNLSLNFIRDTKRQARSFSEIGEERIMNLADDGRSTSRLSEENQTRETVWQALNNLKSGDREIILLKDFQEFSYKEIAEMLEIPLGTVMSRLYYARKSLKNEIERILA